LRFPWSHGQDLLQALSLGFHDLVGRMFQQFPILRACNQGQGFAGSQLYRKISRTAEILEMIVAALPLNSVVDVAADLLINDEHLPMRLQAESQRGRSLKRMHFQTAAR